MPVPRTNRGGAFGGGPIPAQAPSIDVAGALGALASGASSLLQGAYLRRLAQQNRDQALAQQQLVNEDRRLAREDATAKRTFDEGIATKRLALDEQKARTEATHRAAKLRAKGFAPASEVTEPERTVDVSGVVGEGAPEAIVPAGIDPAHYEPAGEGLVRDVLHNPETAAAARARATETTRHTNRLTEIRETARLRPPRQERADPADAEQRRVAGERRAFIARRVVALTKPQVDRDGDPIPGTKVLSRADAVKQAADEWNAIEGADTPVSVAAPAPVRPVAAPSPVPAATAPAPRLRTRGREASAVTKVPVTADQKAWLESRGSWNPAVYEVRE